MSEDMDDASYTRHLTECATLDDLRALVTRYHTLAVDAVPIVATMTDAEFPEFRRGLKQERKGRFAGLAWAKAYGAVLMPMPMFQISRVAIEFHVPFSVAWRRIQDVRPDWLKEAKP